eukprot:GHRQ01037512.1.p2 GENE.GHRQ01037512.1~~GHRQ01037512.1.p2  ORF type:complete len:129 (+),score=4.43 GHRQ01037512.1:573-959(+)
MQPMVRTAGALTKGLGSWESCKQAAHTTLVTVHAAAPVLASATVVQDVAVLLGVLCHLDECVDCHDSQIRLCLGIVDEVEVHQLLKLQVLRLHAVDDMGEQHGDVLAHCHRCNNFLHCFLFLWAVQAR